MIPARKCTLHEGQPGPRFLVMTNSRLNFAKTSPKAFKALIGFDAAARAGRDPALLHLVQIRAPQLNLCAYCLHMHPSDPRQAGESEERLHMVAVWHKA